MALQDLTPQLRTRLSRLERAVGWFVLLALALLVCGFVYYIYNTAERKGWFKTKAPYFTLTDRATGLKVGDPVKLMGFDVGIITRISPQPPDDFDYNVYIEFEIQSPNYGYLWTRGSRSKIASGDLLGNRGIEVTKGTGGYPTYLFNPFREIPLTEAKSLPDWEKWQVAQEIYDGAGTNLLVHALVQLPLALDAARAAGLSAIRVRDPRQERKTITAMWVDREGRYGPFSPDKPYWLQVEESPALTERLEQLVGEVEKALPGILALTNQIGTVLSNSAALTSNLNTVAVSVLPAVTNLTAATAHLDQPGALGEWLLPTNVNRQLAAALGSADDLLANANTNLVALAENLGRSLDNVAEMTSNLNHQVAVNTNMLSELSQTIIHADEFVQGLKRHWLLRSAFKTNAPSKPLQPTPPARAGDLRRPAAKGER